MHAPACLEQRVSSRVRLLVETEACARDTGKRWLARLPRLGADAATGDGLALRASSRRDVGGGTMLGLFATRDVAAGTYVTTYAYTRIAAVGVPDAGYSIQVPNNPALKLLGVSAPGAGAGAGSFVNDSVDLAASVAASDVSSTLVVRRTAAPSVDFVLVLSAPQYAVLEALEPVTRVLGVAVVAVRDVRAGEEMFVSYGDGYWRSIVSAELLRYRADLPNYSPALTAPDAACVHDALVVEEAAAHTLPPYLVLGPAGAMGRGVFACARLRAAAFLGQYQGRVSVVTPLDTDQYALRVTFLAGAVAHYISARSPEVDAGVEAVEVGTVVYSADEQQSNWTRYVNGLTDPTDEHINVRFDGAYPRERPRVHLLTTRVIEPGEQLFVYYGNRFFVNDLEALDFRVSTPGDGHDDTLAIIERRWGARTATLFASAYADRTWALLREAPDGADEHLLVILVLDVRVAERRVIVVSRRALPFIGEQAGVFDALLFMLVEYVRSFVHGTVRELALVLGRTLPHGDIETRLAARYGADAHGVVRVRGFRAREHRVIDARAVDELVAACAGSERLRALFARARTGSLALLRIAEAALVYGVALYSFERPRTVLALCVADAGWTPVARSAYSGYDALVDELVRKAEQRTALDGERTLRIAVDDVSVAVALRARGYTRVRLNQAQALAVDYPPYGVLARELDDDVIMSNAPILRLQAEPLTDKTSWRY